MNKVSPKNSTEYAPHRINVDGRVKKENFFAKENYYDNKVICIYFFSNLLNIVRL